MFELYNGASSIEKTNDIAFLLKNVITIDFTSKMALEASKIYRELLSKKKMIEFRDIFIASKANVSKLPIATLNVNHFERIKGIRII